MVDAVARLKERRPEVVAKAFDGVRSLVSNARLAIEAGDRVALGKLMDLNQMLLGGLFLSTPEIEAMCGLARTAGALGAKLTGAGGGGSVVALVPSSAVGEAVLAAWKRGGLRRLRVVRRAGGARGASASRAHRGGRAVSEAVADRASERRPLQVLGQARGPGQRSRRAEPLGHARRPDHAHARALGRPRWPRTASCSTAASARATRLPRAVALLDEVRRATWDVTARAEVESGNDFPTASGLASSASGFAALALAAVRAYGLSWDAARVSDLARRGSASAARSLFGGFVELEAGPGRRPRPARSPRAGSPAAGRPGVRGDRRAEGRRFERRHAPDDGTEPLRARLARRGAPDPRAACAAALLARDFDEVGELAEASALAMHASAIAAGVTYWTGVTLEALAAVRALRAAGTAAYATIDAGPHVKVLVQPGDVVAVGAAMRRVPGVLRVLEARPGEGAHLEAA